jgi:hypothetical protein
MNVQEFIQLTITTLLVYGGVFISPLVLYGLWGSFKKWVGRMAIKERSWKK